MSKVITSMVSNRNRFSMKFLGILVVVLLVSGKSFGASITPTRTAVSGFPSWTDASLAGTTYLQLITATSSTISPAMDFDSYTGESLSFTARTFNGGTAAQSTVTVSISTNNGSSWTVLGTRVPSSNTLTAQATFDLSSYNGTQVKIKFESLGASSSKGFGIDDIAITGTAASGSSAPTLTAAGSATVDGAFDVTFTDDAASQTWVGTGGTAVTVGGTALTGGYAISNGKITFTPSASVPVGLLQTAEVNKAIIISKTGYLNATVSQTILAGAATKLGMKTQPTAPASNGSVLAIQPAVYIQDQYGNTTTSTASVSAAVGSGTWTLGGANSVAATAGTTTFSGLTATSAAAVTGATIVFSSGSLTGVTSGTFNVPTPPPANDECSGAIELTINASATSGTFAGSTPMTGATKNDVFFMFTPAYTGSHTVTINGYSNSGDRDLYIYSVCPSTYSTSTNVVASGTGTSTSTETATGTFTAGTSYKILVQDYAATGGTFNIVVTKPASVISTGSTLAAVNTTYGTASATPTSFTVSGANMIAGITVTPPEGFEVSTVAEFTSNVGTNASPITVGAAGTISSTTIYVRLAATTVVGSYSGNIVLTSTGATTVNKATASSTVAAKVLTITGLTGGNKPYDGLTTATFTGTAAYSGLVNSESFTVIGTPSASFATADAANTKTITVTGYTAPSDNYTLTQPSLTGDISTVALTITGITANNKTFDGNTSASLSGTPAYSGLVNGETFTVGGTAVATFVDAAVGTTKTVNVTGYTTASANYTLTQPTLSADITAAVSPTISPAGSLAALSTVYGTASSATSFTVVGSSLTNNILVTPPSGFEVSQTVGGESGYAATQTLTQTDGNVASTTIYVRLAATSAVDSYSGNVVLSSTGATDANVAIVSSTVSTKALTIIGLTANPKSYDGQTTVSVTGTAAYSGLVNSESFTVSDVVIYAFTTNGNVGTAKAITQTGTYTVPSSNYSITQPTLTADITAVGLTISGLSGVSRAYNATNTATLSGTAAYVGLVNSEVFSVTGTPSATFADANVGTTKPITVIGYTAPTANYTVTQPIGLTANITKADQTITLTSTATKYVGNADYTLAATSTTSETNPLSYVSSVPGVATIDASTGLVHIVSVGETTFTVSQPGNDNYNAATNATQVLTVNEPALLINFDIVGNWTAGSAAIGSYASNHTYIQNNWTFTGGPALRNTTNAQDGFAGALGTYAWRLTNAAASWTATYNSILATNKKFTGFGFDARRWDDSPSPAFTVEYSVDGGTNWTTATSIGTSGIIDNAALNNASDWITFNQSVSSNTGLPANNFVVRVKSTGATERIMIDNFTYQISTLPLFTGTGEWTSNGNWNTGSTPASDAQVVIDGDITINSSVSAGNITINSGKSLTVNPKKELTVSGTITNNGTLNLLSDENGTATLIHNTVGVNANVEQYLSNTRNWYVSSPVTGAVAPVGYTYYQRDEAGASWTSLPFEAGDTFIKGTGYIALPSTTDSKLIFSGTLNTGEVPIVLTWLGARTKGFNLIGNPYPAHLTWTKTFVDANSELIEPTIYYRTTTGLVNNTDAWSNKSINASSGEASPEETTNIIPPMQAFWVKAIANGTLTLNSNLTKSHNSSNPLKAPSVKNSDRKRLRLQVHNGTRTDETLLFFDEKASNDYDNFDSPRFEDTKAVTQIYSLLGTEKLVMNGMKEMILNNEIPLGFVAGQASSFSLSAIEFKNFDADIQVLLKDKVTNAEFNLTGGLAYQFNTAAENDANRFSVIFRTSGSANGLDNTMLNNNTNVFVNANGELIVKTAIALNADARVAVYNAVGQLINLQAFEDGKAVVSAARIAGVYTVKISNDGEVVTRKIVVN